jgi:hypothetical protein
VSNSVNNMRLVHASFIVALLALGACNRHAPDKMSFFVTSVPAGDGGSFGGLAGADAHCQRLAEAAGSKGREWRAYLSAPADGAQPVVNARDRIGKGPWFNSRGVPIAASLEDLHGPTNGIARNTAMVETGQRVNLPHDMLTGSNADGTLASGDATCHNWSSSSGRAVLGHSDKAGNIGPTSNSWNSAHLSNGCSLADLRATGSGGLFYCFAAN